MESTVCSYTARYCVDRYEEGGLRTNEQPALLYIVSSFLLENQGYHSSTPR